jgi:hypothetical protein
VRMAEAAKKNAERVMGRARADAEINTAMGGMADHQRAFVDHVLNERLSEDLLPLSELLSAKKRLAFVNAVVKWDGSFPIPEKVGRRFRSIFSDMSGVAYGEIMTSLEDRWLGYAQGAMDDAGIDKWNRDSLMEYIMEIPDERRDRVKELARFFRVDYTNTNGNDLAYRTIAANLTTRFLKSFGDFQKFIGQVNQPFDPQKIFQKSGVDPTEHKKLQEKLTGERRDFERQMGEMQSKLKTAHDSGDDGAAKALKQQMEADRKKYEAQLGQLEAQTTGEKQQMEADRKKYEAHLGQLKAQTAGEKQQAMAHIDDLNRKLTTAQGEVKRLTAEGSSKILEAGKRIKKLQRELKSVQTKKPTGTRDREKHAKKVRQLQQEIMGIRKLKDEEEASGLLNETTAERLEATVADLKRKLVDATGEQKRRGIHQMEYENIFATAKQHEQMYYSEINDTVQFEELIDQQTDATISQRSKAKRDVARAYAKWDGSLPIPMRDQQRITDAVEDLFPDSVTHTHLRERFVGRVEEHLRPLVRSITQHLDVKDWNKTGVRNALMKFDDKSKATRKRMRDIANNMDVKVFRTSGHVVDMKTLFNRLSLRILKDPAALTAFAAEMGADTAAEAAGEEKEETEVQQLRQERMAQDEKYSALEDQVEQMRRELDVAQSGGDDRADQADMLNALNSEQRGEIERLNSTIGQLHEQLTVMGDEGGARKLHERLAHISSGLQDALGSESVEEAMNRIRQLAYELTDVGRLSRTNTGLSGRGRADTDQSARPGRAATQQFEVPSQAGSVAPPHPEVMGHVHTILNRTAELAAGVRELRGRVAMPAAAAPPPPPGPPSGPSGGYRSRMPNTNIVLKTGQERRVADGIEKRALAQRAVAIKKQKKRKPRITNIRKAYMEARRVATALLRKERKFLNDRIKKDLKQVAKASRKGVRAKKMAEVKAKWNKFKQLFPHWKKVKTVAALRHLTEQVKTHRLKT